MNRSARSRLGLAAVMAIAAMACAPAVAPSASPASVSPATPAHWTYEGAEGPAHWGELDPAYVTCADGTAQSPIDITNPTPADLADPAFAYQAGVAQVVNNGHSIQANAAAGGTMSVDGVAYQLAQVHFHAPSEHTLDGTRTPVEVHFVHRAADGRIAVVAVFLVQGDTTNAAWDPYVKALGVARGAEQAAKLDWMAMLPASRLTIRYSGSLTTPPCTEAVHWLLMKDPVQLSADQLRAFTAAYEGNDRPVQPLNHRPVEIDTTGR